MKAVCKVSNTGSDVRCGVCGQGFLVDWEHGTPAEHAAQFAAVMSVLRNHHAAMETASVHPKGEFCCVPAWEHEAIAA
jgi:hypothetical protein